jgi:hypothetical protein
MSCAYKPLGSIEASPTPNIRVEVRSEDPENSPQLGTPNEAPTLKPVMIAYFATIKRHDEKTLRKLMAPHFITTVDTAMKEAKIKVSLANFLAMAETTDKPVEVRNEVYNGGQAAAQIRFGPEESWSWRPFTMVDDEWKVTDEAMSIVQMRTVPVEQ